MRGSIAGRAATQVDGGEPGPAGTLPRPWPAMRMCTLLGSMACRNGLGNLEFRQPSVSRNGHGLPGTARQREAAGCDRQPSACRRARSVLWGERLRQGKPMGRRMRMSQKLFTERASGFDTRFALQMVRAGRSRDSSVAWRAVTHVVKSVHSGW